MCQLLIDSKRGLVVEATMTLHICIENMHQEIPFYEHK